MSPGDTPPSFGRYQLMQVVRQDGATTVHDAFDPELGHQVALITSPGSVDTAAEDRLAFRLRRMRHPNVVSVLDMGRQDDLVFVASEHLATEPLETFLTRARPVPFLQGLPLLLQLLSAIEHAHARGMTHATIDLEHVQVTPGGQVKLPAGGWSLSTDRQPNLQAAARMAHVLLAGTCSPQVRCAVDEVLLRAEAADPAARYPRADDFILGLLEAAGYPVRLRAPTMERPLVAEPQPAPIVPPSRPAAVHTLARKARRLPARSRPARNLVAAASLLAALLVPQLVGNGILTDRHDPPVAGAALPMGAAPEAAAPEAAAPEAAAPAAAAPAAVALPTIASTPVETSPVPGAPVAPPAPAPAAIEPPVAVAKAPVTPQPRAVPAAVPHRAAPAAHPKTAARQVATARPAVTRTGAARPQPAVEPTTAAAGCPFDVPMWRDLCMAQQCNRAEMRRTPACVRMVAEQRAALARLRGTPD